MTSQYPDPWTEEREPRWGCAGAVVLAVVLVVGVIYARYYFEQKSRAEAVMTASAARLTLEKDDGDGRNRFDRRETPEVWFRVTLDNAPLGRKIELVCMWVDPNGTVAHRSRYQTREIDKTPWPTHARCQLRPDSPLGTWTVRLLHRGRELSSTTFEVCDEAPAAGTD